MKFYIASGFQNKHLVQFVASKLKEIGWHHTYDWTQNERATNREQLQMIGQAEKQAIQEADVFLLLSYLARRPSPQARNGRWGMNRFFCFFSI